MMVFLSSERKRYFMDAYLQMCTKTPTWMIEWSYLINFIIKKCPEIICIFAPVCLMYACSALVWTQCPSNRLDCLEPQAFRCDFAQNIVNTCASAGVHFAEQPRAVKQHKVCSVVLVDTAHTCAGAARCFFLLAWTTQSVMSTETIGSNYFSCLPKNIFNAFIREHRWANSVLKTEYE